MQKSAVAGFVGERPRWAGRRTGVTCEASRKAFVCLRCQQRAAMMTGLEHATGEGISAMSGDCAHYRAPGQRICRLHAGALNRAGHGGPPACIDSRR
jgi:hypothetical protein